MDIPEDPDDDLWLDPEVEFRAPRAWVVRWDAAGEYGWRVLRVTDYERHHGIAAVLPPVLTLRQVKPIVELLYARAAYDLHDQLHYLVIHPRRYPDKARTDAASGTVTCGGAVSLIAKLEHDLSITPNGELQWRGKP